MRKFILLTLLALPLFLVSCSSDDESDFDYDLEALYGTWRITHMNTGSGYVNITTADVITPIAPTYATFNSDGTYSGRGVFGDGSGTYKAKGKRITCYIEGVEYVHYDVISLTGNACELTMVIMASEGINIKCEKQ